ncbi:MAG TPA: GHKL domain-containing protein [Deltaproteobacteria bacterium]|nr:GHKL domain-containing protein [Deltaproteobacteria bacterium]
MSEGADDPLDRVPGDRVAELAELGVLTATLIHELRQPLFAVKGRLQLTQRQGGVLTGAEIGELLQHLLHVEELLDHYAGLGQSGAGVVDLREPVQRALSMLAHRARQLAVHLVPSLPDAPLYVAGRETALRQVAVNLLQNALDAVSTAEEREIRIELGERGGGTVLEVSDTGPGVPEALQPHVFQPFVTTKAEGTGTGLGLYIARKLVQELGGSLELEQPEGGGTRATVILPRRS